MTQEIKDSKYFKLDEFRCKCGCGQANIKQELIDKLTIAREMAGVPFDIRRGSGYRCKSHNKAVGGANDSQHLYGTAVDIPCFNSIDRFKIINSLLRAGFTGIGIAKNFVHGDIRDSTSVVWLY